MPWVARVCAQYEVSDDADSVQMLQRSSQLGEFYRMMPPPVWQKERLLPPQYLDLLIYDEELDQLKHIDFKQALHATGAEDDPGAILNVAKLLGLTDAGTLARFKTQLAPRGTVFKDKNGADVAASEAPNNALQDATLDNLTVEKITTAIDAGIWVPVCITICRPFIEHLMMSAICTVSGRDTGATLFGPADMQISANTSVKTIEGASPSRLERSCLNSENGVLTNSYAAICLCVLRSLHVCAATQPTHAPPDPCPACTPAHNTQLATDTPSSIWPLHDYQCTSCFQRHCAPVQRWFRLVEQ